MIAFLASAAWALGTGTHVLDMQVVSESRLPIVGRIELTTHSRALVEIARDVDGLWARQRVCSVEMTGKAPGRTTLPDAFLASLPETRYRVALGPSQTVVLDQGVSAVGFDLSVRPSVPSSAGDPSVLDSDGDGHPGATVHVHAPVVGRVEVYVAQIAHTRLMGTTDGTQASGRVETLVFDQQTLGASHPFFRSSPPVSPVPGGRFTLTPAPGVTCESLSTSRSP